MTSFSASALLIVLAGGVLLSGCGTAARKAPGMAALASPTPVATSQTYIAALGTGVIGRNAAADLSKADRVRALEAEYRALEAAPGGQPVVWAGRDVSGSVVAAAPYQVGSQNCRQYSHTLTIKTQQTMTRGAACRNPDGTWTPLT